MTSNIQISHPAVKSVDLSIQIGAKPLLKAINLQFPAACWTAIVGPNGAGKSTLLAALAGLQMAKKRLGHVELMGRSLDEWPSQQRARTLSWTGQIGRAHV